MVDFLVDVLGISSSEVEDLVVFLDLVALGLVSAGVFAFATLAITTGDGMRVVRRYATRGKVLVVVRMGRLQEKKQRCRSRLYSGSVWLT